MNNSDILESIRIRVGTECLFNGNSLKRGNCSVNISGVSDKDRVVVDLDKVYPHGKQGGNLCECVLLFFDNSEILVVIPIELKGGKNAEAAKAVEQLKGGAAYAADYVPSRSKTVLVPFLFHNHLSRLEIKRLRNRQSRIQFAGKSYEIRTARCGSKLIDVIP